MASLCNASTLNELHNRLPESPGLFHLVRARPATLRVDFVSNMLSRILGTAAKALTVADCEVEKCTLPSSASPSPRIQSGRP